MITEGVWELDPRMNAARQSRNQYWLTAKERIELKNGIHKALSWTTSLCSLFAFGKLSIRAILVFLCGEKISASSAALRETQYTEGEGKWFFDWMILDKMIFWGCMGVGTDEHGIVGDFFLRVHGVLTATTLRTQRCRAATNKHQGTKGSKLGVLGALSVAGV